MYLCFCCFVAVAFSLLSSLYLYFILFTYLTTNKEHAFSPKMRVSYLLSTNELNFFMFGHLSLLYLCISSHVFHVLYFKVLTQSVVSSFGVCLFACVCAMLRVLFTFNNNMTFWSLVQLTTPQNSDDADKNANKQRQNHD